MSTEPVKFLLVDDVDDNLLVLEALLRREGLTCVKARSGTEALEALLEHDFALAFLDVQMPGMDGFELAELMRGAERSKHVPIIFVTAGNRDPGRVFKGYESGAVDFLYKPIDTRILQSKADVFFELYRQRMEFSQILQMNEMFVGTLSHDLRTPLGTVLAATQVLLAQTEDAGQKKTLERMNAAGRRMADMIDQLLDLTRARLLDGVGLASARQHSDVTALVQRAVDELQGSHPELQIVFQAREECVTAGDAGRLLQLFSNLVGNAVQHGTPGTPITVDVSCTPNEVAVSVHNSGTIAADVMPTLFDPFRRRGPSGTKSRGLGLGLYISQQVATAHGGSIEVVSNAEAGTTFTARLPRRPLGHKRQESATLQRTVLVVDDDRDTRDSLEEAFEAEGYGVVTASNGLEALERLSDERRRPDVVVLDIGMPMLNGNQVYDAMRKNSRLASIPVVVSTAEPRSAPPGVVVIPKPLKLERLLETVAALCRPTGADVPSLPVASPAVRW